MVQAVARKPTSSFSVLIQVFEMHIKQVGLIRWPSDCVLGLCAEKCHRLHNTQVLCFGVQVIIEGYKSYKDQIISEPFDQHINVVGMPLGSMYGKKMFGPGLQ